MTDRKPPPVEVSVDNMTWFALAVIALMLMLVVVHLSGIRRSYDRVHRVEIQKALDEEAAKAQERNLR